MKIIFLIIIILILINYDILLIYLQDISYYYTKLTKNALNLNSNLNLNNSNDYLDKKILIISFDNRKNLNYLEDHNKNVMQYIKKHKGIEYKFFDKTDKNVYWVKIYLLRDWLITSKYDYVMWMDTDAMFVNYNIDLKYVLGLFNSDIFLSHDNDYPLTARNTLNAGVFIIKNSEIGINFLNEAINTFEKSKCINKVNKKLSGIYGHTCYEQGVLNMLLTDKYKEYVTVFSPDILSNTIKCRNDIFMLHNYDANIFIKTDIKSCFNKINSSY